MKSLQDFIKEALEKEETRKSMVCESSVNRIRKWLDECDVAFMTAFRDYLTNVHDEERTCFGETVNGKSEWEIGHKFAHEENRKKNKQLVAELRKCGYGVIHVKGIYPEGMNKEVTEESYMVFNQNHDKNFYSKIFELSEFYNQDSFFYKPSDSEYGWIVGTNDAVYPGYNIEGDRSKIKFGVKSNYMSTHRNVPFTFISENATRVSNKKDAFDSLEKEDKQYYWLEKDRETFRTRKTNRIKNK